MGFWFLGRSVRSASSHGRSIGHIHSHRPGPLERSHGRREWSGGVPQPLRADLFLGGSFGITMAPGRRDCIGPCSTRFRRRFGPCRVKTSRTSRRRTVSTSTKAGSLAWTAGTGGAVDVNPLLNNTNGLLTIIVNRPRRERARGFEPLTSSLGNSTKIQPLTS